MILSNIKNNIMRLEVLISCLEGNTSSIVQRLKLKSDALIVNQCGIDNVEEIKISELAKVRILNSSTKGLSVSRNIAISQSNADICLLCDDDEILSDTYNQDIIGTFLQYPNYDVIAFKVDYPKKSFPVSRKKIGYISALKVSSVQIAFRRERLLSKKISFNEMMGAGTGNGGGEENKFLYDCLKSGLKILYVPICIAKIDVSGESTWFRGYDNRYFLNKGWTNKMIFGYLGAILYDCYFAVTKYRLYSNENTFLNAIYYMLKGTFQYR